MKFDFKLRYKDVKIFKHSLEKRIEADKVSYERLKKLKNNEVTDIGRKFIKEHEEHVKCLYGFVNQMKETGIRGNHNVFGSEYED